MQERTKSKAGNEWIGFLPLSLFFAFVLLIMVELIMRFMIAYEMNSVLDNAVLTGVSMVDVSPDGVVTIDEAKAEDQVAFILADSYHMKRQSNGTFIVEGSRLSSEPTVEIEIITPTEFEIQNGGAKSSTFANGDQLTNIVDPTLVIYTSIHHKKPFLPILSDIEYSKMSAASVELPFASDAQDP